MTITAPLRFPSHQIQPWGPRPIPCDPSEDPIESDAWDLFVPEVLTRIIDRNAYWLQFACRTTSEVLGALFYPFDRADMQVNEIYRRLNDALWDAGYRPSHRDINPRWILGSLI